MGSYLVVIALVRSKRTFNLSIGKVIS